MTNLSIFTFENHTVRTLSKDNEPWFIASDICKALKLENTTKAIKNLDDDEKALTLIQGLNRGNEQVNIISESGMYTLVLRCRDAVKKGTIPHRFRKWVTSEVLPSIRKTGSYSLTINTQQQHAIKEAVSQNVSRTGRTFQAVYHDLYNRFQIPKYQDLLSKDFNSAIEYLGTPQIEYKKRYDFPLETADPHDRKFANAWMTPRVMLDKKNRAPDLELLESLERDGYDVSGAKVRIYALYSIVRWYLDTQHDLETVRQYLTSAEKLVRDYVKEHGNNITFASDLKDNSVDLYRPHF